MNKSIAFVFVLSLFTANLAFADDEPKKKSGHIAGMLSLADHGLGIKCGLSQYYLGNYLEASLRTFAGLILRFNPNLPGVDLLSGRLLRHIVLFGTLADFARLGLDLMKNKKEQELKW